MVRFESRSGVPRADPSADNSSVHIDFAFHARSSHSSGVFPLVGERQFAAGVDEASDDHRQAILDPGFFARVKSTVQSKFLGQFQQRIARPVFLRGKDLEILCGALGTTSPRKAACNNLSCSKVRPVMRPWVECLTLPFSR